VGTRTAENAAGGCGGSWASSESFTRQAARVGFGVANPRGSYLTRQLGSLAGSRTLWSARCGRPESVPLPAPERPIGGVLPSSNRALWAPVSPDAPACSCYGFAVPSVRSQVGRAIRALRGSGTAASAPEPKGSRGGSEVWAARENLIREFPRNGTGVEVGTWKGGFAARLLAIAEPTTLHLVDPWEHREETEFQGVPYGSKAANGQQDLDEIYNGVLGRFAGEIESGKVIVHRMASKEAAAGFQDGSVDWVYIDGDHHYDAVKSDLELWYPKVRAGGLLSGDDFRIDDRWWGDGVTRAVEEFAARTDAPPLSIENSQFCFRRS
jgi:Methyltransferase domain